MKTHIHNSKINFEGTVSKDFFLKKARNFKFFLQNASRIMRLTVLCISIQLIAVRSCS